METNFFSDTITTLEIHEEKRQSFLKRSNEISILLKKERKNMSDEKRYELNEELDELNIKIRLLEDNFF